MIRLATQAHGRHLLRRVCKSRLECRSPHTEDSCGAAPRGLCGFCIDEGEGEKKRACRRAAPLNRWGTEDLTLVSAHSKQCSLPGALPPSIPSLSHTLLLIEVKLLSLEGEKAERRGTCSTAPLEAGCEHKVNVCSTTRRHPPTTHVFKACPETPGSFNSRLRCTTHFHSLHRLAKSINLLKEKAHTKSVGLVLRNERKLEHIFCHSQIFI